MLAVPRVVWMPGGVRTAIHLAGEQTGGAFCLLEDQPPVGWSLPAHLHHGVAETIHVVEGDFEVTVAGEQSRLSAGQTVHVPAEVIHSSENVGALPGRRLMIFSPSGMERFFLEAGAPSADVRVDMASVAAVAVTHGWEFVTAS